MRPLNRPLIVMLAAGLTLAMLVAPAAARQQIGPRVKVDGNAVPAPDPDTFATADDPAIGLTAPTLEGEGFNEQTVTVAQGESPRIVVFLAHWCPHCQAEVPVIVKLARGGGLDGVDVDTVATSTSRDQPNFPPSKWLKREKWPFKPVLTDDARSRALAAFGGNSFPYFVFVNDDGTVAGRWSGELGAADLETIAELLVAGDALFE